MASCASSFVSWSCSAAAAAALTAALAGCGTFGDRTGALAPSPLSDVPAGATDAGLEARRALYERDPGEKAASIAYACALRGATRYGEAAAVMQAAAIRTPKDEEVLSEYGKALADAGELSQAKDVLTRASTPDDPKWDVLSAQGAVADRMGDHASAMQFYRDALKIAPHEPAVLTNMGLSLALAKRLVDAEQALKEAAASPKADATTRGDLALVLALEGKYAEAEKVDATDLSAEQAHADVEAVRRVRDRAEPSRAPAAPT